MTTFSLFELLLLALAGATGACMRYGVDRLVQQVWPVRWPAGIWLVNLSGAALAGWLAGCLWTGGMDASTATILSVGFAGSYTTFSGWMVQTLMLAEQGRYIAAAGNVLLNIIPGYMLCLLAFRMAAG